MHYSSYVLSEYLLNLNFCFRIYQNLWQDICFNYCAYLSIIKNVAGSILIFLLYFSVIGRAAFTGKHRWLFSEAHDSISSFESQDIFQVFLLLLLQLLTTLSRRTLFSSIYVNFFLSLCRTIPILVANFPLELRYHFC